MCEFSQLDAAALGRIRKTSEDPPRVSVYDLIGCVTGQSNPHIVWNRLITAYPHFLQSVDYHQFDGSGQRKTPVVDASGAQRIIQALPGKSAARVRAGLEPPGKRRRQLRDDLYIMRYSFWHDCVKIGRSHNVEQRRKQLEAGQDFHVEVVATFPGMGCLESVVHGRLADKQSRRGAGVEWFEIDAGAAIDTIKVLADIEET